jgi:anaerobic selenocysteine-containing dehydrogenase
VTREKWLDPSNWASLKPFGIGEQHPNNYLELWEAFRENRDQARYAWRILTQGTCDGCALGTKGMRDWTTRQVHLCNVRLRLLRLNTMPALDTALLADVTLLARQRSAQLRHLGRLPYPMVRRRGRAGLHPDRLGRRPQPGRRTIRASSPERLGVYLISRGTPNETYFAAQKAVRALGTNSVDNAARVCHSPSTFGLKGALGVAATTCSYSDWIGSDLIVFVGANPSVTIPSL